LVQYCYFKRKLEILKNITRVNIAQCFFLDFSVTIFIIFFYGALSKTTASEGFILAYTWPILVLILSFVILKDKITLQKLVGILISFLGTIIITTKGNISAFSLTNLQGDILALSGAFVFALFSFLGKTLNVDKTISVFIYFLSALVFVIPTV
jgi:drug/metabolite transporter (DMT)-like permease